MHMVLDDDTFQINRANISIECSTFKWSTYSDKSIVSDKYFNYLMTVTDCVL